MITLYGVARSRASRNIWLLHEMGKDFTHVPVIQAGRLPDPMAPGAQINTCSPEFLKVNPTGRIPACDVDGLVLNESLAINLHLARRFGGALGPQSVDEDGLMTQWAIWAMTEVEPHTINILYHRVMYPPEARDESVAQAAIAALAHPFAVLDAALAQSPFLVGGRFTVADINMAEVVRYAMPVPALFEAAPHMKAWLAACHARPAYQRMMEERNKEPG